MAKFKAPSQKKKAATRSAANAIPCLVFIVLAIVVVCLLFYFSLESGGK